MGLSYATIGLFILVAACCMSVNGIRIGRKAVRPFPVRQRAVRKTRHVAFLKRPSVVCHCSYRKYLRLKARNLLRRGEVIRLERGKKLSKKFIRDVIYAPLCCKIDLSNPNKLYRYPMTICLTQKVFSEEYKDTESAQFEELSNELINTINQLFQEGSALVNVEVSGFRPGSIIADLILTTKGIFPQDMYDTLRLAIDAGQLGNLHVALVPEGTGVKGATPGSTPDSTAITPEGTGITEVPPDGITPESTGTTDTAPESTGTTGVTPEGAGATEPPPDGTGETGITPESTGTTETTPEGAGTTATTPETPETPETPSNGAGTTGITPESTGTTPESTGTTPESTGTTPESTGTTPEGTGTTPEGTGTTPESTGTTPESTGTTPESTGTTPESTGTTPEGTGTTPEGTGTTPESTGTTPESTGTTPESPGTTPEGTVTTPESTGTTPEGTVTTPESTGTTPESTGTTPESTGTTPESTGITPESTGTTPESTGTTPESTGTTPEGTGTTPESTGTTPESTGTHQRVLVYTREYWYNTREYWYTPESTGTTPESTGTTPESTGTTPESTSTTPGTSTGDAYNDECLCAHNQKREAHGVPPLVWSATIAASAKEYAEKLAAADSTNLVHEKSGYGENLFVEFGSGIPKEKKGTCVKAVDNWYDEIGMYNFDNPGFSSETGHFTQVVWKASKEVGVAEVVTSTNKRFIVGRYSPPGNVRGQFQANVPRPVKGNITTFAIHTCTEISSILPANK
ncbi:mucin-4-like [Dendronephthya gigantea]|uniref:mucin-4-like n=1 Tax=Dendronephthya gigantea TaxID=151771 RepID=UPI00106AAB80|nr:mucin-4-like [Dendronephthya gigantea]